MKEKKGRKEEKKKKQRRAPCTVCKYSRLMVLYASACLTSPDESFRVPGKVKSSGAAWMSECIVSVLSMRLTIVHSTSPPQVKPNSQLLNFLILPYEVFPLVFFFSFPFCCLSASFPPSLPSVGSPFLPDRQSHLSQLQPSGGRGPYISSKHTHSTTNRQRGRGTRRRIR